MAHRYRISASLPSGMTMERLRPVRLAAGLCVPDRSRHKAGTAWWVGLRLCPQHHTTRHGNTPLSAPPRPCAGACKAGTDAHNIIPV